jgi:hypothetical protein
VGRRRGHGRRHKGVPSDPEEWDVLEEIPNDLTNRLAALRQYGNTDSPATRTHRQHGLTGNTDSRGSKWANARVRSQHLQDVPPGGPVARL